MKRLLKIADWVETSKRTNLIIFLFSTVICFGLYFSYKYLAYEVLELKYIQQYDYETDFGDHTEALTNMQLYGGLLDKEIDKVENRVPPIYPYFLFTGYKIAHWLNLSPGFLIFLLTTIVIALTSILIFKIGTLLYTPSLALLGVVMFSVHPYILQGITKAMSVTLFICIVFAAIYMLLSVYKSKSQSWYRYAIIGVLLGLAMLTRPIGLLLPILFSVVILIGNLNDTLLKRILYSSLIIIGAFITVLPWQMYNYAHGQKVLLASANKMAMVEGVNFNFEERRDKINLPADIDSLTLRVLKKDIQSSGDYFKVMGEEFRENPGTIVKLIFIKAGRAWYGVLRQEKNKEIMKFIVFVLLFLPAVVTQIITWNKSAEWKYFNLFFLLFTFYFWGMAVLVVPMARYMIPVFALAIVYLPKFVSIVYGKVLERINRT